MPNIGSTMFPKVPIFKSLINTRKGWNYQNSKQNHVTNKLCLPHSNLGVGLMGQFLIKNDRIVPFLTSVC